MSTDRNNCYEQPIIDTTLTTGYTDKFTLTIKVYQANYGKYLYFEMTCPEENTHMLHPFRFCEKEPVRGTIADNTLVRLTFDYLCLPDDQLKRFTGNTHIVDYRALLIQFLTNIWE